MTATDILALYRDASDEQLTAAVAAAIAAHDMTGAVSLMRVIAVLRPSLAETLLTTINIGIEIARSPTSYEGCACGDMSEHGPHA